jgi:hypothetical protein
MPSTTLAGWENRIRDYSPGLERSTVRKLAKAINRRFESYNDCDLAKVLQHSDPTGETATHNVDRERNQVAAERRMAVAA